MPITELRHAKLVMPDRIENRPLWMAQDSFVAAQIRADVSINLSNHLIFPAWINAHDHLHLNHVPPSPTTPAAGSYADSYEWIDAFQTHFDHPAVKAALAIPKTDRYRFGGLKNALSGATTVMHHDPWHTAFDAPDFPVRVMKQYGWSHSLGLSARGQYGPTVIESYQSTPPDTNWFIHLAEGRSILAQGELMQLLPMDCLHANTVLIHGVGLSERDIDEIIAHRATVIWCPSSNLKMLGCSLNPRRLYDAGCLGLGTDSRLTGSSDLLAELPIAKACSDLTPRELFELITTRNRTVVQIPDAGRLDIGGHADCVIVRDDGRDPFDILLDLARASVRAVVRNGLPLVADPDLANWFSASGVPTLPIIIDNAPKLIDAHYWLPRFHEMDRLTYMEVPHVA